MRLAVQILRADPYKIPGCSTWAIFVYFWMLLYTV